MPNGSIYSYALDAMSDSELVTALRTEIVRPPFPNDTLFQAEPANRTCIRYLYRLPKLVGPCGAAGRFEVSGSNGARDLAVSHFSSQ